jgi:PleD family two-component response regulator
MGPALGLEVEPGQGRSTHRIGNAGLDRMLAASPSKMVRWWQMDPTTNSMIKILVVEDEPIFRGLLGSVLESSGYHVEFAIDGLQALEILSKEHRLFDLVITDIQMPPDVRS